jgi:threonine dehydrogenase-like Zn-dependent dehydrogenase
MDAQPGAVLGAMTSLLMRTTMQANVFHGINDIRVDTVPKPSAGPGEALLRITATTICGTDLHIVRGE